MESVKNTQSIDLVINLEEWDKEKEYDRLGLEEQYTEFLGNKVVCHNIPIRPGRNLAIICETAAKIYLPILFFFPLTAVFHQVACHALVQFLRRVVAHFFLAEIDRRCLADNR
mgnify:CR=1 FL=1